MNVYVKWTVPKTNLLWQNLENAISSRFSAFDNRLQHLYSTWTPLSGYSNDQI